MSAPRFIRCLVVAVLLGASSRAQFTERVSVATGGAQGNEHSGTFLPRITDDGRYVVFYSDATNLVSGDTNGFRDAFLRDRKRGTTELVSVSLAGGPANGNSGPGDAGIAISADGRYVAFYSA